MSDRIVRNAASDASRPGPLGTTAIDRTEGHAIVPATPRRRVEGAFAVALVALVVAAATLLVTAEEIRQHHGVAIGRGPTLAVGVALLVILTVGVTSLRVLAERRRAEDREKMLSAAMARLDAVHGFARALGMALCEVREMCRARDVVLAVHEGNSPRGLLWTVARGCGKNARADHAEHGAITRTYLRDQPADAWEARRRGDGGWDVLALNPHGRPLKGPAPVPPDALDALAQSHGARGLAGIEVAVRGEWRGRVLVIDPRLEPRRQETLRLAQRLVGQLGPLVQSRYVLGRMRARIGAMERARIARELHDGTIQSLVGVEMEVDVLRQRAAHQGLEIAADLLRVRNLLRGEVLELRDTMQRLKPIEIAPEELAGHLDGLVSRFERDTGIRAIFDCPIVDVRLPPRVCREVARIVQEALQNVRKHSGARNVLVRLHGSSSGWRVVVDDDGQGFQAFAGTLTHAELEQGRKGPYVIRERVRALGGELTISTAPGGGARLEIALPQEAG